MINDILDFSKIEAGKLDIESIDFNLVNTISQTYELLAPRAREKGLALSLAIDPAAPPLLQGDPGRLRQILTNLVGNAIKFTARGHIDLRVDILSEDGNKLRLRFAVSDTGIGIAPDQLKTLFTPFVQADSSITRQYGGTGLGLSISRRLVELMDGKIGADSRLGAGSTFWFELPFTACEEPEEGAAALAEGDLTGCPRARRGRQRNQSPPAPPPAPRLGLHQRGSRQRHGRPRPPAPGSAPPASPSKSPWWT